MQDLAKSFMNELRADISANRKLNADFDDIVNKAPLSAEEGIKLNLIDGTRYLSDLEKELTENGAQNFVHIMDYVGQMQFNSGELPTVAVLNLNGVMDTGNSDNELAGDPVIGSADVAEELAEISELPDLRAVIVRVNSPGGSYNAADEIYYALQRLKKEKNVPLIISQSGYAASGGYFVSLAGDYIVAEPTTVTGSIGVLGGKFVLADLWKKLGINWESITVGKNADILSLNKPFTPAEQKIFNASLDDVYNDFTAKTVENRPLKKDINLIARGRVWSGRQAFDLGLVDELGGFRNALKVAAQRGGISPNEKYKIVEYPRAKSVRERIGEIIFGKFVRSPKIILPYNVDIRYLKLFKRLQYDTVTVPFIINM
jgi:protease-4